jgi:hypothetical protein
VEVVERTQKGQTAGEVGMPMLGTAAAAAAAAGAGVGSSARTGSWGISTRFAAKASSATVGAAGTETLPAVDITSVPVRSNSVCVATDARPQAQPIYPIHARITSRRTTPQHCRTQRNTVPAHSAVVSHRHTSRDDPLGTACGAQGVLPGRLCLLAGGILRRYGDASRAEQRLAAGDVVGVQLDTRGECGGVLRFFHNFVDLVRPCGSCISGE